MRPDWLVWYWGRLAWGKLGKRRSWMVWYEPQSSVPGMPWERFEYVGLGWGLWWRKKERL